MEVIMAITKELFGKTRDGKEVYSYTITNKNNMSITVMTFGAILKNVMVPDKKGKVDDVVLGYDKLWMYFKNGSCFGSTIGPIANRTEKGKFTIGKNEYQIPVNDRKVNNLHTDLVNGFHKRVWDADVDSDSSVTFTIEDPATLGFPGNKKLSVTYTITDDNELKLHYVGSSDENTILNPTNHSYFNLDGFKSGSIVDEFIQIEASVKGTPMDLTSKVRVGDHIDDDFEQLNFAGGYDHNFCVRGYDGSLRKVATVWAAKSSRIMEVYSDLPGVQFYAGNFIKEGQIGKEGAVFNKRYGLCLETQYYPDAIHHSNFQSPVFGPDRKLDSVTVYAFKN